VAAQRSVGRSVGEGAVCCRQTIRLHSRDRRRDDLAEAVARVAKLHAPMHDSPRMGDWDLLTRSHVSESLASPTIENSYRLAGCLRGMDGLRRAIGTAA
jgi:hypothetical protein